MPANTVVTIRKGSGTEWSSANPVLANGELGFDTTNRILKIGNGTSTWTNLNNSFTTSFSILSDTVASVSYMGKAPLGSSVSDSVWTIKKTTINSDGTVASTVTAVNVKWDDRLTANYT